MPASWNENQHAMPQSMPQSMPLVSFDLGCKFLDYRNWPNRFIGKTFRMNDNLIGIFMNRNKGDKGDIDSRPLEKNVSASEKML